MKKYNQIRLLPGQLRHRIGIAIALMSTIPLLISGYVILFYFRPKISGITSLLLLIAITCSILGIYLIGQITFSILRLHRLTRIIIGEDNLKWQVETGRDELKQLNEALKIMGSKLSDFPLSRTSFENLFHRELQKSTSAQKPCGLVLLQIVDYYHYSERYSRDIVSSFLIEIGQILIGNLGGEERLIRYNSDKLALILPGKTATQVKAFVEITEKKIRRHAFVCVKEIIKGIKTKSAFVVCPTNGTNSAELLQKAEERLNA